MKVSVAILSVFTMSLSFLAHASETVLSRSQYSCGCTLFSSLPNALHEWWSNTTVSGLVAVAITAGERFQSRWIPYVSANVTANFKKQSKIFTPITHQSITIQKREGLSLKATSIYYWMNMG